MQRGGWGQRSGRRRRTPRTGRGRLCRCRGDQRSDRSSTFRPRCRLPDFGGPAAGFGRHPAPAVREGSVVRQGQTLYQIDPSLYQAQVAQASANVQSARASAEAARARAERYRPLAEMEAVSKQDYTDALAQARQANAAIAQNNAALRTAQINLRYTRVPAPISGRIGLSNFTEGALVTANQAESLATITRLDPIYVDIQQSAPDLLALRRSLAKAGCADHRPGAAEAARRQRLWLHRHGPVHRGGGQRRHRLGDAARAVPQPPEHPAARHVREGPLRPGDRHDGFPCAASRRSRATPRAMPRCGWSGPATRPCNGPWSPIAPRVPIGS